MLDWEAARDWEMAEAISDMENDSYCFVGRDIFLRNGAKTDFLRYREEGYIMESRFYWSEDKGLEGEEVMAVLEEVRELLMEEGFKPRLSISHVDSKNPGYNPELEGDYYIDDVEVEALKPTLDSITPPSKGIERLKRIK